MRKPCESDVPLLPAIQSRFSPVWFSDRPIPDRTLLTMFEAARWAPSSYNEQPWRFLIATRDQTDGFEKMASCLIEANRVWATTAYVLGMTICSDHLARNGNPNRHAWHDVGLATAQIIIQAAEAGIQAHLMGGFDTKRASELFDIPENYSPVTAFALGYPAAAEQIPAELKSRAMAPRTRMPIDEILMTDRFGHPFKR